MVPLAVFKVSKLRSLPSAIFYFTSNLAPED